MADEVLKEKYAKALKMAEGKVHVAARIVGHSIPTFYKYAKQFRLITTRKPVRAKFNGKTKLVSEWAKELKLPPELLWQRLRSMPVKKAFTLPYEKKAA